MTEVKWIKITTNMFDDEKIEFIESLPESDAIIVTWVKLLTLAGKCNANGFIFLTESIPYTYEMLAHKFRRKVNVIQMALDTLERLDMIELLDGKIRITNWEKHQNVEGLDKIREQTRLRVQRHREKQKLLPESNATGNATETQSNATELELEEELEKKIPFSDIVKRLNEKSGKNYRASTRKTKDLIKARWNEGFGLNDFITVIDKKVKKWEGTDMEQYIRPETLFGTKFEGYLNEPGEQKQDTRPYQTTSEGMTELERRLGK